MKYGYGLALFFFLSFFAQGQSVKLLQMGKAASFRGLSVVTNNNIWVSGSQGTVGLSKDGGRQWKWMTVAGFEKTDFRDIEAFNDSTAIIMGIGEPAYILRTTNAGESWDIVYENKTKGMFLDALDFYDDAHGIVVGDPINGKFFMATTLDAGKTWQEMDEATRPLADSGEACFASSGTNIKMISPSDYVLITGGLSASLITPHNKMSLPLLKGKESTGANSIAVYKKNYLIAGGDFNQRDASKGNFLRCKNKGKYVETALVPPTGYRSCIAHINKKKWITCGLNGVDISNSNGLRFYRISNDGFHVVQKAKKGNAVYLAGGNGRIGLFIP
ncbi:MAG: oxidoreductase [Niastella sp. SCN 39-18]|nr:oxidoreductase [Sphingobacteriales bacterium]ODT51088.1 MAG: oxidoreductase [Niastella sp. SCN 39-18]OJW10170.1 MAG: oxidoreductase [Sphingobacteriales bacterium 39-19]